MDTVDQKQIQQNERKQVGYKDWFHQNLQSLAFRNNEICYDFETN
jgi:hypothetical protein